MYTLTEINFRANIIISVTKREVEWYEKACLHTYSQQNTRIDILTCPVAEWLVCRAEWHISIDAPVERVRNPSRVNAYDVLQLV